MSERRGGLRDTLRNMLGRISDRLNQGRNLPSRKPRVTYSTEKVDKMIAQRKERSLDSNAITELIRETHNPEYIYKCLTDKIGELGGLTTHNIISLAGELKDTEYLEKFIEYGKDSYLRKYDVMSILEKFGTSELIKKCIDEREKYSFDKADVLALITKLKDVKYVIECIDRRDELELDKSDVSYISRKTSDPKLIEKLIEERDAFGYGKGEVIQLLKALQEINPKLIDKYIYRRDEFELEKSDIVSLITGISAQKYIESYIKRKDELGFSKDDIVALLRTIKNPDPEYMDGYIEKRDEYGFEKDDIVSLVFRVKDLEYADKYVDRREEFGFTKYDIILWVKGSKNIEPVYIDKYISRRKELGLDKDNILELIELTADPVYFKKCIDRRDELGLEKEDVVGLIKITDDPAYLKKCVEQKEKLGLDSSDVTDLIIQTKDPKYLKKCIEQRDKLGLDQYCLTKIILNTNDTDYIKKCIDNRKELGLSNKEAIILGLSAQKDDFIDEQILEDGLEITLADMMTIGMEIETVGKEADRIYSLGKINGDWTALGDTSLHSDIPDEKGVEVTSSILTGDPKVSTKKVKKAFFILKELGQYGNESCGGHIHIGANYLKSPQAWRNLIELWTNTEYQLYVISNKEGEIPRTGVTKYAIPMSGELAEKMESGEVQLEDEEDLAWFKEKLVSAQMTRYKGLNFQNLKRGGKGTLEFRLPNAPEDARTWIENINLFGGIIRAAQELAEIQAKDPSERTEEEQHKLECFEKIRNKESGERETLEQLLELTIPEKSRDTYRRRYETNSKLLKENDEIDDAIRGKVAEGPVNVSKDRIGKEIYTGEDRVTGDEHKQAEEIISRDIEQERDGHQSQQLENE